MRETADSEAVGGTHCTDSRRQLCQPYRPAERPTCVLPLPGPEQHVWDTLSICRYPIFLAEGPRLWTSGIAGAISSSGTTIGLQTCSSRPQIFLMPT